MKDRFDTKMKGVRVLETAGGLVANLKITIETKMKEPQLAEVKILIIKKSGVYFRTIRVNLARCDVSEFLRKGNLHLLFVAQVAGQTPHSLIRTYDLTSWAHKCPFMTTWATV